MIKLKCTGCGLEIAQRESDNVYFGAAIAKAPCDVMCKYCGALMHIPMVPSLSPEPTPKKAAKQKQ